MAHFKTFNSYLPDIRDVYKETEAGTCKLKPIDTFFWLSHLKMSFYHPTSHK